MLDTLLLLEMFILLDFVEVGIFVLQFRLPGAPTLLLSLWAKLLRKEICDPMLGLLETQRVGKGVLGTK